MCRIFANIFVWLLGLSSITLMISLASKSFVMDWFADPKPNVTWTSAVTTIATGPFVLLCAFAIERNVKLQMFTWAPLPIALIVALWIFEDTSREDLQDALQAAFSASAIGVIFDVSLLICISQGIRKWLWWIVIGCTIASCFVAYAAAGDRIFSLCLGIIAAAMNILNIPHMGGGTSTSTPTPKNNSSPGGVAVLVIPFVWTLLTTSVVLQQLGYLRAAGIISNAPCLHFVVAFMLWWTSTHSDDLKTSVLLMMDNIGIGSVSVFSSSVFTAIFWQCLRHTDSLWTVYWAAIGASIAVAIIMYFYTWIPNAKERYQRILAYRDANGRAPRPLTFSG